MSAFKLDSTIPKLPGMGFGEDLLRTDFRKTQLLDQKTGVKDKPVAAANVKQYDTMLIANTHISSQPVKKMTLDRKVLRFQGYFKEGVHESPQEQERVRKCIVYYYLEDDTISVSEPKQDNSGITGQGSLIKRHQIPCLEGGVFNFEQLNVGQHVTFYGKTFYLLDCDPFTRRFLSGLGIEVPPPEDFPQDQYTTIRKAVTSQQVPRKPKCGEDVDYQNLVGRRTKLTPEEISSTKQFLANDKKVLSFYCLWDDRNSLYGDVRLFTLYYFLADDTIEVTETNPPNCGRDPFPSFVKRSKVPKVADGKTFNPKASLSFKKEAVGNLTDEDLRIGNVLNIYNRHFLIYDCDIFSKSFLHDKFGITDFTPIDVTQPGPPQIPVSPPPYNGFGDEEDSLGSWKYLVLKAPKKDTKKYMENANNQLKFQLRLQGGDPSNAIRKFVLTYYLSDDTVSIFEPAQRNSGIIGGKFLQRQKVKNVGPDGLPTGENVQPKDLYVGAKVVINTHHFIVYHTDERSLAFMESHPELFPKSNIDNVLMKLRAMMVSRLTGLKEAFSAADVNHSGCLDYQEFASIFEKLHLPISEQEILTVMRFFDKNSDGQISWEEFMSLVMPPDVEQNYASQRDQTWLNIQRMAEAQNEDELDRFNSSVNGTISQLNSVTDQAVRQFLRAYNERRELFLATFRTAADNSLDECIGEAELRKVVLAKLKLDLNEKQVKAIALKLFPEGLKRIPVKQLEKILNGTSTYTHFQVGRS